MKLIKAILSLTFAFIATNVIATSWDEPWQDRVMKEADCFVFANVKSCNADSGITIDIIKTLAGKEIKGQIKITDFYLLDLCSSSGHGPEFHFDTTQQYYFFIHKNKDKQYCIATPTAGFSSVREGNVSATYRHSYHKAVVPVDVYEKTMTAIFNNYHNLPYEKEFITTYAAKYLSQKPAGFEPDEINTFFAQHVALECIYHLHLADFYPKILPFLTDTSNFHNQVSAARALVAYNTTDSKNELLKIVGDTTAGNFLRVMCIWTLATFKPTELKTQIQKAIETASDQQDGFGGNIMDPRVCTYIPSVKEALTNLAKTL